MGCLKLHITCAATAVQNQHYSPLRVVYRNEQLKEKTVQRFISVDPIADKFPHVSTYNYAENSPISNIDLHGLQAAPATILYHNLSKKASNFNATRTGLNRAQRDLTGKNPNFVQRASNTVFAATIHFGNLTSQNDVSVLGTGQNLDGSQANGFDKTLAGAFVALPVSGSVIKNLAGEGVELLGKFVSKFTNQASHLDSKHVSAAVGDILGNPVTIGDKTYDHLDEVQNALGGLGKQLGKLNDAIGAGSFSGDALDTAQNLRSTLQKQKDQITDVLNRARDKAGN